HGPQGLSIGRLRLRRAEPDPAGDPQAAPGAETTRAHRPARHRFVPQFRALARALAAAGARAHARDPLDAAEVVRYTEYPLVHDPRFRGPVRRARRRRRAGHVHQSPWPAEPNPLDPRRQPVRRTGAVSIAAALAAASGRAVRPTVLPPAAGTPR